MTWPEGDEIPRQTEERAPAFVADVRWGTGDIVIGGLAVLGLLAVFVTIAGALILAAGFAAESAEGRFAQVLASVAWDASIVAVVFQLARRKGSGWRDLGLRAPRGRPLAFVIAAGYIVAYLSVVLYGVAVEASGIDELMPGQQVPEELFDEAWVLASFGVLGVTLVPFAEELFFRGFFFAGLRRRLPFLLAAGISGLFFSLAHGDPGLVIPFTGVGMVFAYLYERTGSLYAPIGVHVLFNLVSLLALILVPDLRG
jgi:membrane protease YdiL (CAAX protease family)